MDPLTPCSTCDRHVRAAERCPFCDAPLVVQQPRGSGPRVGRGQLTRAAIFAGATLLAPACGGGQTADDGQGAGSGQGSGGWETSGGGGGEGEGTGDTGGGTETADAGTVAEPTDAGVAVADAGPEQDEILEEEQWQHRRGGQCVNGICPPYGAPPADLVAC